MPGVTWLILGFWAFFFNPLADDQMRYFSRKNAVRRHLFCRAGKQAPITLCSGTRYYGLLAYFLVESVIATISVRPPVDRPTVSSLGSSSIFLVAIGPSWEFLYNCNYHCSHQIYSGVFMTSMWNSSLKASK